MNACRVRSPSLFLRLPHEHCEHKIRHIIFTDWIVPVCKILQTGNKLVELLRIASIVIVLLMGLVVMSKIYTTCVDLNETISLLISITRSTYSHRGKSERVE